MSAPAHISSPRDLMLARAVEQADQQAANERADSISRPLGQHSIVHLEVSTREVDLDDLAEYLPRYNRGADDLVEYRRAIWDAEYERGNEWPN
jgi:hypothetical protein